MALHIMVNFNGNCREAVMYYTEVFGLEQPRIMTYGDVPPDPEYPLLENVKDLIMFATLNIHGSTVMFSDVSPGMPYAAGNNINLTIVSQDMEELRTLFHKLEQGGTVDIPLQETFWSKCYGNVTDRYGIQWQFNYDSGEAVG